jgi:HEAT repeat protein
VNGSEFAMRKPLLVTLLVVLGGCAEPRYHGKTAGMWLDQLKTATSATERWRAAQALGAMGPEAREAVPELSRALKSDDAMLRAEAATALGHMGPAARPAVPALKELLTDKHPPVRDAAENALKAINAEPQKAPGPG